MSFESILFAEAIDAGALAHEAPACFADLQLGPVVDALTAGREEYDLKPFFYTPLKTVAEVEYRHQILRDLEQPAVFQSVRTFARQMRQMRQQASQAQQLHNRSQRERWYLDAVATYGEAVTTLTNALAPQPLRSRGFQAFRAYLTAYVCSPAFIALVKETQQRYDDLAGVGYTVQIKGNRVTVDADTGQSDYSAEVQATFARFQEGAAKKYLLKLADWPEMDTVESRVLERVARLYPEVFHTLDQYVEWHACYLEGTLARFDREVQCYLAYLDYCEVFRATGLAFCYPAVSTVPSRITARDTFDVALAHTLLQSKAPLVCNDFALTDPERLFVVTGPNQGGKTTFARTFGQLHYLASLGLPVPGTEAQLLLPDAIYTHFEREEDLTTLHSKLEDELVRLHGSLTQATSRSILILNETFASTTLQDAIYLGTQVLQQMLALEVWGVYVTFVDELTTLDTRIVSLVSTVAAESPTERTYKLARQPANGRAYAEAIAAKYGLTYATLKRRIARRSSAQ